MSMPDVQRALALIEGGQHADAVPLLEDVTHRFPAYVFAHVVLARTYEALERWDDALAVWRNARFLMPSSPAIEDGLERTLNALVGFDAAPLPPLPTEGDGAPPDETEVVSGEAAEDVHALLGEAAAEHGEAAEVMSFAPEGVHPPEEPPSEGPPLAEASAAITEPAEEDEPAEAMSEADAADAEAEETVDEDEAIDEKAFRAIEQMIDERLRAEGLDDVLDPDEEEPEGEAPPTTSGADDAADPTDAADTSVSAPDEDLDTLIQELESARFEPRHDLDDLPEPQLDNEIEDMVSETLARIYVAQDKFEEAAKVYEQLAIQQPDRSIAFLQKAADMRSRAAGDD